MRNNRLLIFLHEDIIKKPLESIQSAYNFLGVCISLVPESINSRPQKVLYNLTRLKLMSLRNKFIFDYNDERTRLFEKKMSVTQKCIAGFMTILEREILSRFLVNSKPTISSELRLILYEKYVNDIDALELFIERDLSAWRVN